MLNASFSSLALFYLTTHNHSGWCHWKPRRARPRRSLISDGTVMVEPSHRSSLPSLTRMKTGISSLERQKKQTCVNFDIVPNFILTWRTQGWIHAEVCKRIAEAILPEYSQIDAKGMGNHVKTKIESYISLWHIFYVSDYVSTVSWKSTRPTQRRFALLGRE